MKVKKLVLCSKKWNGLKRLFLNILSGSESSDSGPGLFLEKNLKISFLSQEPILDPNATIERNYTNFRQSYNLKLLQRMKKRLTHPEDSIALSESF